MNGVVKRIARDKGFGFIQGNRQDGGKDYFFHYTALKNIKFEQLQEGQEVTFEDVDTPKGLRAEQIFV